MDATNPLPATAAQPASPAPADHDEPYRFGRQPTVRAPFPFTERQFARLLIARGRLREAGASASRQAA
jgi:hypothetical protein